MKNIFIFIIIELFLNPVNTLNLTWLLLYIEKFDVSFRMSLAPDFKFEISFKIKFINGFEISV